MSQLDHRCWSRNEILGLERKLFIISDTELLVGGSEVDQKKLLRGQRTVHFLLVEVSELRHLSFLAYECLYFRIL